MNNYKYIVAILFIALTGCARNPMLRANINSVAYLNPDIYNRPSPVVVTFYQLQNQVAFNNASYFSLYAHAPEVLGNVLLDKESFEIKPQRSYNINLNLSPKANYVAVVAGYRSANAKWRKLIAVPKSGSRFRVKVLLQSQSIYVSPVSRELL